jgi:putative ABC transport system permease protein
LTVVTRAIRNISRRKIRALLVIIALGFSFAMMISIPPSITANQAAARKVINDINSSVNNLGSMLSVAATEIDCSLPATIVQNQQSNSSGYFFSQVGGPTVGASSAVQYAVMNRTHYSAIGSISEVTVVIPILQVNEHEGQYDYQIEGIPLNSSLIDDYPILPTNITAGRTLQTGDNAVVVLSEENANHWGVNVGATVNILGQSFKVIGIHGTSGISDVSTAFMSLEDAQRITGNFGNVTTLKVFVNSTQEVSAVSGLISQGYPELTVSTSQSLVSIISGMQSQADKQLQQAQNTLNQIQSTALVEIIVSVVATSAIVLLLMLYTVRERTKEIGTLKAIGFSNWNVMSQFMLEGMLLSLFGGIVGVAIGMIGATSLSSLLLPRVVSPFGASAVAGAASVCVGISPELMLIGLGAAILLGSLGSVYPAWKAARIRPAEAMRYE